MDKEKFKKQIESIWKHRDTDEQKRLLKFGIAKTMRLTLTYPKLAQEYYDSLCKVIPDNERITVSNYHHNLTSDAEGEEMLTVPRKKVQELFNEYQELYSETNGKCHDKEVALSASRFYGKMCALSDLFGSKCLLDEKEFAENANCKEPQPAKPFKVGDKVIYHPFKSNSFYNAEVLEIRDKEDKPYLLHLEDAENIWAYPIEVQSIAETYPQEPKPAEPKYHVGQRMYIKFLNKIGTIDIVQGYNEEEDGIYYHLKVEPKGVASAREDFLEPYTEPKEDHIVVNNEMVKDFDTILKDGFSKERRLNIAKDFASVLLSRLNYDPFTAQINCCCSDGAAVNPYINIARIALSVADALIAESEKGGSNGED